jgi:hypothetical protein
MAVKLKRLVGNAGAGLDESMGFDTLYDVLKAMVEAQNDLIAQFNQLRTDYDASTVPTGATAVTAGVEVE